MGKTKDQIWNHWTEDTLNKVSCKYCKKFGQEKHATRCKNHSACCISAPAEIRKLFEQDVQQLKAKNSLLSKERRDNRKELYSDELYNVSDAVSSTFVAVGSSQSMLEKRISKISPSNHKELELLWTKSMITGNVSFNWTRNIHLQKFFEKLGSGFILPARRDVSTTLLKQLDEESQDKIAECIKKEKYLSIVPDGWQNVRGLSVINVMLANPTKQIFYKSIETGNQPH
jgi:hypothetical protein